MRFEIVTRSLTVLALGAVIGAAPLSATAGDTGPTFDPDGRACSASADTGPTFDPNGIAWETETGPSIDPNGIVRAGQRDTGPSIDPDG